jgi:hypothetical protein
MDVIIVSAARAHDRFQGAPIATALIGSPPP